MNKKILVLASYLWLLLLVGCGAPKVIDDADEVVVDYVFTFPDGTVFERGTTVSAMIVGSQESLYGFSTDLLLGKQVDDVLSGTLPPATAGYDLALQQKLAEPYLSTMGDDPVVWDALPFSNIGTGIVRAIGQEEWVKQYTIDFNPRETYESLNYEVKVVSVEKK